MKLNIKKINNELRKLGRNKSWLAKQIPTSRQRVDYWFKSRTIKAAEPISVVLDLNPKDLLIL